MSKTVSRPDMLFGVYNVSSGLASPHKRGKLIKLYPTFSTGKVDNHITCRVMVATCKGIVND
jgi:hypothetical protein